MDAQGDLRIKLAPETIEAISRRVVELLRPEVPARSELVDAAELARRLGIERSWIYSHAIELGVIKLGDGSRPRLRFDPRVAVERIRERSRQDRDATRAPRRSPEPVEGANRPRLLPIKGGGAN